MPGSQLAIGRNAQAATGRLVIVAGVLAALGIGYGVASGGSRLILAFGVAIVPGVLALLIRDVAVIRANSATAIVPWAMVSLLPLLRVLGNTEFKVLLLQVAMLVVIGFLLGGLDAERRAAWLAPVRPTVVPAVALLALLGLSYALSGFDTQERLLLAVSLLTTGLFFVLGAGMVDSAKRVEWAVALLVLAGVVQLPIIFAQFTGLTDSLPGFLSDLSSASWRAADTSTGGGRFPGTFHSVELLAEYVTILTLLGIGLVVAGRTRALRLIGVAGAGAALLTGYLTGTRGYFVAVAIGLIVLVAALVSIRAPGTGRMIFRILFAGAFLLVVAYIFVPQDAQVNLIARFADLSLSSQNFLNRGDMFEVWIQLVQRMPLFGHGSEMIDVINASFPLFEVASPHSLYFWLLLTAGFPGFAAFLWWVGVQLMRIRRAIVDGHGSLRLWACVFAAVIVAILANEFKIDAVRIVFYIDWLMFLLGVIASASLLAMRASKDGDAEEEMVA